MTTRRPLVRALALEGGRLHCPRRGVIDAAACATCPFACRDEAFPHSVACSWPIPAAETFLARGRHSEGVRIALRHRLERT